MYRYIAYAWQREPATWCMVCKIFPWVFPTQTPFGEPPGALLGVFPRPPQQIVRGAPPGSPRRFPYPRRFHYPRVYGIRYMVYGIYRDTFRIKIYRSWEYLCFKFVWRWRRVPSVGCFRFRGFAPVVGPDCGGVLPYKATPWVTLVVYPTMCGWSVS